MALPVDEAIVDELNAIKKLLILQLLASGYKQKQVAATLGVSEPTLSRMLPKGIAKDLAQTWKTDRLP